jgi:ribosomal protein S14
MIKYTKKNILKIKLLKIKLLKNLINNIIKKSIFQNRNINKKIRLFSFFNIKKRKSNKNNKVCLFTGRRKGIIPNFNLSRHQLNKITKYGKLQNFKTNS